MIDFNKIKAVINNLHTGEGKTYSMCKYIKENKNQKHMIIVPNLSNVDDVLKELVKLFGYDFDLYDIKLTPFLKEHKIHIPSSVCKKLSIGNLYKEEDLENIEEKLANYYLGLVNLSTPIEIADIVLITQYNLGFVLNSYVDKSRVVSCYLDFINSCDNIFIDELDSNLGILASTFFINNDVMFKKPITNDRLLKVLIDKEYDEVLEQEFKDKYENKIFQVNGEFYTVDSSCFVEVRNQESFKSLLHISNIKVWGYSFDSLAEINSNVTILKITTINDYKYNKGNDNFCYLLPKELDINGYIFHYKYDLAKKIPVDDVEKEVVAGGYLDITFPAYDILVANQSKIIGLSATIFGDFEENEINKFFTSNKMKKNIEYNYVNVDEIKDFKISCYSDFNKFREHKTLFITPTKTIMNKVLKELGSSLSPNHEILYLTSPKLIGSNDFTEFEFFYFLDFKKEELITPYTPNNIVYNDFSLQEINKMLYIQTTIRSFDRKFLSLEQLKKKTFVKFVMQTLGRMNRGSLKEKYIFYNSVLENIINIHKKTFKIEVEENETNS
jgi:hypothetical protein